VTPTTAQAHAHAHAHTHSHTHTHTRTHTHTHTRTSMHARTGAHAHAHAHAHARTHARMHARTHARTQIQTHEQPTRPTATHTTRHAYATHQSAPCAAPQSIATQSRHAPPPHARSAPTTRCAHRATTLTTYLTQLPAGPARRAVCHVNRNHSARRATLPTTSQGRTAAAAPRPAWPAPRVAPTAPHRRSARRAAKATP
jgi:hypothetical protein